MSEPGFARLPPRAEIANLLILALIFAGAFVALYGGSSWLSGLVPWRVPVAVPLDARIPFIPGAAAVYLTIAPMLWMAPLVLRDLASFLPLFATLMLETAIAAICFLLLPVDAPAIECCEPGASGALFHLADAFNLERNYLPSLHVAFAFTAAAAYARRAARAGRIALYGWAVAVAASTLVTRQHFVVDVVAGIALAWACWRVAGAWARRADVLAAFDTGLARLRARGARG